MTTRAPNPRARVRRLPAEWETQAGVQLTWPHADSDWGPLLDAVEETFVEITRQAAIREQVLVAAANPDRVRGALRNAGVETGRTRVFEVPSNDAWTRDHGPITVYENDAPLLLDFVFNGWGGKFPSDLDNAVTRSLHELRAYGDARIETLEFVLEGGAIDSDGAGTLLTTSQCLLTSTRNGGLSRDRIEEALRREFGLDRVLWLNHGYLAGDDTDSHVDTLARFCDASTIAYVSCSDENDEHFESLAAMETELTAFRTADGLPYRLVPLPLPAACYDEQGARLPATYANFLVINGAVLAPVYGVPEDVEALSRLACCFPDREIVGIPCRTLIQQHGSLHCVTMQIPEGVAL